VRIVGVVALPVDSDGGSSATGVALSETAARSIGFGGACPEAFDCAQNITLTYAAGVERAAIRARYEDPGRTVFVTPLPPGELDSLLAVKSLPMVLAVFLATIGVVALAYTASMTVRRRTGDLALLRTLGMTSREIRRVVLVQTAILVGAGLSLGLLLGVLVGRVIWRLTVDSVHVAFSPIVPAAAIVAIVFATIAVAQLATAIPRRRAAGLHPAVILRRE
jgi:hypothetical protein